MLPLLKTLGDGKVYKLRDIIDLLADKFELAEEERKKLPSGSQVIFSNHVGWAKFCLLSRTIVFWKRGYVQITDLGLSELQSGISELKMKNLNVVKFQEPFWNKSLYKSAKESLSI